MVVNSEFKALPSPLTFCDKFTAWVPVPSSACNPIMDSPRKRQQAQKEEYARLLNEHKEAVRTEGVLMRKAIDTGSLKDVLKHAIELLDELRTSSLTPKVRV